MDEKAIYEIINSIKFDLWWTLIKLFVTWVILSFIKDKISIVVGYFLFRSNKYVSIGSTVIVDGFCGTITHITISEVIIESSRQVFIVPMNEARNKNWIVTKVDCDTCENNRSKRRK